jgi:hypothetical protein
MAATVASEVGTDQLALASATEWSRWKPALAIAGPAPRLRRERISPGPRPHKDRFSHARVRHGYDPIDEP